VCVCVCVCMCVCVFRVGCVDVEPFKLFIMYAASALQCVCMRARLCVNLHVYRGGTWPSGQRGALASGEDLSFDPGPVVAVNQLSVLICC
jgi:hypothetical protein